MKKIILLILVSLNLQADQINKTFFSGLAVEGYDVVAYFKESKPVKGKSEFEYSWNGAKWRFSSNENLELFKKDPNKYSPEYGGFCAYAMSEGYKYGISPDSWEIVNGKLYLNYDKEVQMKWTKEKSKLITQADSNWKKIAGDKK
ncbi:MAG: YHS domain-containing (seleno)protein [Leptospiraceae bacterium]|nr:YHS domain-containing (seleno)protein [Leptospiraceae bacterium]